MFELTAFHNYCIDNSPAKLVSFKEHMLPPTVFDHALLGKEECTTAIRPFKGYELASLYVFRNDTKPELVAVGRAEMDTNGTLRRSLHRVRLHCGGLHGHIVVTNVERKKGVRESPTNTNSMWLIKCPSFGETGSRPGTTCRKVEHASLVNMEKLTLKLRRRRGARTRNLVVAVVSLRLVSLHQQVSRRELVSGNHLYARTLSMKSKS